MQLGKEQLRSWDENGFFISDLVICKQQLDAMAQGLERVFNRQWLREPPLAMTSSLGHDQDHCIRQAANAWRVDPVLEESALTPEIGLLAGQLAHSPGMRLLMDWVVHKPGVGQSDNPQTGVGFHQDLAYWGEADSRQLITARIPLDHETASNVCMRVVPGSHRLGLMEGLGNGFWSRGDEGQALDPHHRLPAPIECELKPGQVMFHHCLLLHGTGQNRTGRPRRSQNIHMMPADTRYITGMSDFFQEYAARHQRQLRHGQRFDEMLFPAFGPQRWPGRQPLAAAV
jgi:ectoine hydroxylase-related dioxygenase (phytanoyl-CoA dioxygenase family)